MRSARVVLTVGGLFALGLSAVAGEPSRNPDKPTHQFLKNVAVKGEQPGTGLQTLCVSPDGHVLALVAPGRYGTPPKGVTAEVHVLDPEGSVVKKIKLGFVGQSLNTAADGTIYVAGDGKIAKFDKAGKPLAELDVPHIAELLKDAPKLRKQAVEQLKAEQESFAGAKKNFEDQVKKLKDKEKQLAEKKEKLSPAEQNQLRNLEQNVQVYDQIAKQYEKKTVDEVLASLTGRLKIINGVAVSEKDVFIACGESKGYGYSVWRMDHDLKNPKQVLSGLGGCCGQMDVQCCGDEVVVALNTRHSVGRYTRDGKAIATFGKRAAREGEGEGFGSCCNPMNVRGVKNAIFTAESEGIVKEFTADGKFIGLVGKAAIQGGCKNVAVGVSPGGDRVYFCDQPGSRVIILARNKDAATGGQ